MHLANPYPTEEEKVQLSYQTGLNLKQVNTWFGNHRGRYKRRILDKLAQKKRSDGSSQSTSAVSTPDSSSASVDLADDCGAPNWTTSPRMTRQRTATKRTYHELSEEKDPDYEPETKKAKKLL